LSVFPVAGKKRCGDSECDGTHKRKSHDVEKKSLGGKMLGRQSPDLDVTSQSANDNSPSRTVAGEGVVQCLHFLARELENLAFPASAADVLSAAFALQAAIDASRHPSATGHGGNAPPDRTIAVNALAPTA